MEKPPKAKVQDALTDIDKSCDVLQVQVLNNLDALLNPEALKGPDGKPLVNMQLLDQLVKGPMMRAITKIRNARIIIIKNSQ